MTIDGSATVAEAVHNIVICLVVPVDHMYTHLAFFEVIPFSFASLRGRSVTSQW